MYNPLRVIFSALQGVIASGLGVLYAATGDTSLLDEAEKTLDAVVSGMTDNGILKEVCDDAVDSTCNEDQVCFFNKVLSCTN